MNRFIPSISKTTAALAVAFLGSGICASAMPASPFPVMMQQPDGSWTEVRIHGDEHTHIITTPDGSTLLKRDSRGYLIHSGAATAEFMRAALSKTAQPPERVELNTDFPAHGKQKALAILVEFPETDAHPKGRRFECDNPRQLFDDLLNKEGFDFDGATGSVRDFFLESSCGAFDLTFDVFGPITLEHDLAYYNIKTNGENLHAWHMVEEGCRAIDDIVDFNDYDRDHDGIIDNVYVFYAGQGGATGGNPDDCIWQHASEIERLSGETFLFDGVRLNHYACSNECRMIRDDSGTQTWHLEGIGTVCHEFSHVMGLPDLYDTTGMGLVTPGLWSTMDTGCHLNNSRTPPLMTALERMSLGWLEPRDIGDTPMSLSLRDLSSNEAFRIYTADNPNEYFLLENRQQKGWDAYLPGHGLLVWHINYMPEYWKRNMVNTIRGMLGVDIVRADSYTASGHTFPGSSAITFLGDEGYPNMLSYSGNPTNAPISRIMEAGGIISFDVCKAITSLEKVDGIEVRDITPTSFSLTWNPQTGADYRINIYTRENGNSIPAGAYENIIVSDALINVEGLQPDTRYYATVTAVSGTVAGEISDEVSVDTPAWSFCFYTPQANEASDISHDRFTASWQPLEGATDYIVNVFTAGELQTTTSGTDFSDGLDALPPGWSTNCSSTMAINGYYGKESPSLLMSDDYARIQSPAVQEDIAELTFWYRERSGSGLSYIEISFLSDGKWSYPIATELPQRMSQGSVLTLGADKIPSGALAVRIVYRRMEKGSLAIDDIEIKYVSGQTYTPVDNWTGRHTGPGTTSLVVDRLLSGTDYYYNVLGVDNSGTASRESGMVKATTLENSGITDTSHSDEPHVYVSPDGTVHTSGHDGPVEVFDLQGRSVNPEKLPHGIYLVKAGNTIFKLAI